MCESDSRSPGRARRKPLKPLHVGTPGETGGPVVTMLVCLFHHLHARLRVQRAPGVPHALFSRRRVQAQLGRFAPRDRGLMWGNLIAGSKAMEQSILSLRGEMDCFAE